MITITLNGDGAEIPSEISLAELIRSRQQVPELIVVELNELIIKRDQYATVMVKNGDVVELLKFVGGG